MTEEMTEDKTKEELNEENPLVKEVSDVIASVIQVASAQELKQFAVDLAACATRIAAWAGYVEGMNKAKQLAKDVIAEAEQQLK